ncbi:hypothetical protein D9M73_135100 [compost metagenome]
MRGRNAARHPHAASLGGADQIETGGGRDLANVQCSPGFLGQHQVARDRQRLGNGGGGGQAHARRGLARRRHRARRHAAIFGMGDDGEAQVARISQHFAHHARIGDPACTGADCARARVAVDRHFGEVGARQPARCRGDRMNPQAGAPDQRGALHDAGVVEHGRLIGHQTDADDATGMESGQVDREHAQIDDRRGQHQATTIDRLDPFGYFDQAGRDDRVALDQHAARRYACNRADQRRVEQGQHPAHAQPATPRERRVKTSRQAIRTATPISTCSVMAERA